MKSSMNIKGWAITAFSMAFLTLQSSVFTSCSDMLDTDSELVEFEDDNTLNHLTDSVYSVMGIVNAMQQIADRVVLFGEVRGDLMTVTPAASQDLQNLSNFKFDGKNKYNQVSDYYAVINNCNYFLAHIDTTLQRRGRPVFMPEYAAVKSFRAWIYLQLALAYGEVPLILKPLMTEKEAQEALTLPRVGLTEICQTFIDDLTPLVGVQLPDYGLIGDYSSRRLFIPMRLLLGDLCLYSGRYNDAVHWYHEYLNDKTEPVVLSSSRPQWPNTTNYTIPDRLVVLYADVYIPMEQMVFNGTVSQLPNLYNSTEQNRYYYELTPSTALRQLSAAQRYVTELKVAGATKADTIYAPRTGLAKSEYVGDLRFASNYSYSKMGNKDEYSEYSLEYQSITKVARDAIITYTSPMTYLRYAEALNRAGYPQSAMVVLKYGVCQENFTAYVDTLEQKKAGQNIYFDPQYFKLNDTDGKRIAYGIHSYGCGDAHADTTYTLPLPPTALATRQDTIDYQIPLVEDMIIDEMALEGAFAGNRFNDLMRVALRRNDPSYLANKVARRSGTVDAALQTLLLNKKNWFLPLPQ